MRFITEALCLSLLVSVLAVATAGQTPPPAPITAIKAGRLIDPETATVTTNQVILVEGEKIKAVGANLSIPAGATLIGLSRLTVLPCLCDAHTHMALTEKQRAQNHY